MKNNKINPLLYAIQIKMKKKGGNRIHFIGETCLTSHKIIILLLFTCDIYLTY